MFWILFLIFLGACFAAGSTGGLFPPGEWYRKLDKPSWTPPDWVFAPIWITLYLLMGVSVWLVWWRAENRNRRVPMTAFGVQLALNLAWSFIFFGARSIGWAAIELGFLWAAIAVNISVFWGIDRLAGGLLVPYFLWASFAAVLNISIYALN